MMHWLCDDMLRIFICDRSDWNGALCSWHLDDALSSWWHAVHIYMKQVRLQWRIVFVTFRWRIEFVMICTSLYETGQAEDSSSVLASSWILRGLVEIVMFRSPLHLCYIDESLLYDIGPAEESSLNIWEFVILRWLVEFVTCRWLIAFVLYRQVIAISHRPVGGEFTQYSRVRDIAMTCWVRDVQMTHCICVIQTSHCYMT